jgi:hypothetical protein
MYSMSANVAAASTLLSQLISDPSGELLQSLRGNLEEAVEKFTNESKADHSRQDAVIDLQPVFATARDILDKATLAVEKVRSGR